MKISIPKPCHENWDEMIPLNTGRFCKSCQKCIVDITSMKESEILRLAQLGNICVKIKKENIEAVNNSFELSVPRLFKYSAFFFILGIGGLSYAQQKYQINYSNKKLEELYKKDTVITIKSQVHDGITPIANAKVYLANRKNKYQTYTDGDGNFELTIPSKFIFHEIYVDNIDGEIRNYKINHVLNMKRIGDELILGYLEFNP
jgi:hypothetical protein